MRKIAIVLFAIALCDGAAHAQSVAQTLVTLTNRVTALESRPGATGGSTGSPLVVSTSEASGGWLHVLNSQKRDGITLFTDVNGGEALFYNNHSLKRQISLGITTNLKTGALEINDETGDKLLARFGSTGDGTAGYVEVNGARVHDYAEVFDIAECHGLTAGSVVAASSDGNGIHLSGVPYDPAVVGVISGAGGFQPGMQIGSREDGSSTLPVAVSGQVYVRVSAEAGTIAVGDLLVSSSIGGVAMRGADKTRLTGTVIGKALQPYAGQGESLVRMLVMVR